MTQSEFECLTPHLAKFFMTTPVDLSFFVKPIKAIRRES